MTRRTNDQLADRIAEALDTPIAEYWRDASGEGITWAYGDHQARVWTWTSTFRNLVRWQYFEMEGRGLKPAVLSQVVRNIEARARYGQRQGGAMIERVAS